MPLPFELDTAPDLASLQYPWSDPPLTPGPAPVDPYAAPAPELQPGIGVPAAALDAAVPPAPLLGPPPEGAPPPFEPPAPTSVAAFPDLSITTEPPPYTPGAPAQPVLPSMAPPAPPAPGTTLPPGTAGPTLSPEEAHYRQTAEQYAGNPLAIPDEAERHRRLNELDPFQLAEANTRDQQDRAAFVARRRKEYADADAEAARQHADDWKAANARTQAQMDALLADADRLANTKIDPSGGVHGGRLVAGVIASIIGGLVQGRTGSARNAGLDALTGAIDRGIDAQKADLARQGEAINMKRNVLGAEFARHGDMYHAEEAVRLATWQHVDDTLAFEAQNYDPRGRTALLIANQRQQIKGAMAQAQAAYQQKRFENNLKLQDAARQQELADETRRHNRASEYVQLQELGERRADRGEARAQRLADKEAERADKEAERDRQFGIGGVPQIQLDAQGKPVTGPDGKPVVMHASLTNADGKRFRAGDAETTRELRQKKTAATEVIAIIDEIRDIRNRVGGESRLFNSKDAQRLSVLQARAKLLTKQGTQGMSSDKDMDTIEQASGTGDADSWRDQDAKLGEARALTERSLNQAFADAQYTGKPIAFPVGSLAKNTAADDHVQDLLERPKLSFEEAVRQEVYDRTRGWSPGEHTNEEQQAVARQAARDVERVWDDGATPQQQRKIAELGIIARGSDRGALDARKSLSRIATDANTGALRQFANAALQDAVGYGIDTPERTGGASYDPSSLRNQLPRGESSRAVQVPAELAGGR